MEKNVIREAMFLSTNITFGIKNFWKSLKYKKYLFGDIYEWAGVFRDENLYKSERVLSGGAAEYADYHEIETRLSTLLSKYEKIDWTTIENVSEVVMGFLLSLWSIHPFREGNTRTCITFLWHYLKGKGIDFQVALQGNEHKTEYSMKEEQAGEQYKIAKADYEAFREKYSIKKNGN